MKEGYYWIQHNGVVQVAYYTNDTVDDLESGRLIVGVWHLTRGDDICHNGEAEVISPVNNKIILAIDFLHFQHSLRFIIIE